MSSMPGRATWRTRFSVWPIWAPCPKRNLAGFSTSSNTCAIGMKAVILAAGVGKRLWEVTQHRPKCLIEIGGRSLLHRYLESLAAVGIRRAEIVVGYKQEMIRAAVEQDSCGVNVTFLVNEQFHRGSISSLWIARTAFDDDTIVMDADVLFHPEILRRLVSSSFENALLMDETVKQTGEECMVVVAGGRVVALTKNMPAQYDYRRRRSGISSGSACRHTSRGLIAPGVCRARLMEYGI